MDRNGNVKASIPSARVALRKESVDRNEHEIPHAAWLLASLSARRAWIEIPTYPEPCRKTAVALRKESVDRNSSGNLRRERGV